MIQHLGGRDRRIATNSRSAMSLHQDPILGEKKSKQHHHGQKPEEISKQASSVTCSLGLPIYLKSQRGGGDSGQRLSDGNLHCSFSIPPLRECFKEMDGRELCSTCILFIDPSHPESCDRNNQTSAGASLSSFQSRSGRRRPGGLGSTQLIQKLAQLAWYWWPP